MIRTRAHEWAYMQTHAHPHAYTRASLYMCPLVHAHSIMRAPTYMRAHRRARMRICMRARTFASTSTHAQKRTHTYVHPGMRCIYASADTSIHTRRRWCTHRRTYSRMQTHTQVVESIRSCDLRDDRATAVDKIRCLRDQCTRHFASICQVAPNCHVRDTRSLVR